MDSDQAAAVLAQYSPDIDATLHTGLAYVQTLTAEVAAGVFVCLVGFIIVCMLLRPTEKL